MLFLTLSVILASGFASASKAILEHNLCVVEGIPFVLALNSTRAPISPNNCYDHQRLPATLSSPAQLVQLAALLYECAVLTQQPLHYAWINRQQAALQPFLPYPCDCLAVNAFGNIFAGTPQLCNSPASFPAICMKEKYSLPQPITSTPSSTPSPTPSCKISTTSTAARPIQLSRPSQEQPSPPLSSGELDSDFVRQLDELFIPSWPNGNPQKLLISASVDSSSSPSSNVISSSVINVDGSSDYSLTTPTPTTISSTTLSSSTSIAPTYRFAHFHILGYKLITNQLSYSDGDAACESLGMRMASINFVTHWLAALVIYQGSFSRSLAWINSHPAIGKQQGCIAMRAAQLSLTGARIQAHDCQARLPVLCQGPVVGSWQDVLDAIRSLENMARFIPGMEALPPVSPFFENVLGSLNQTMPFPRLPDMETLLGSMHLKSANRPLAIAVQQDDLRIVKLNQNSPSNACSQLGFQDAQFNERNMQLSQSLAKENSFAAVLFYTSNKQRHSVLPSGEVHLELSPISHEPFAAPQYIVCQSK